MARSLLTVGHSNHTLTAFMDLLKRHAVDLLVDVRSDPYSRYAPQFTSGSLRSAATVDGIGYLYMGNDLGGKPKDRRFYDATGRVDYRLLSETASFLDGLGRLEEEAERRHVAIMCSEERPGECHRRELVGRALIERDWQIEHIRGDGRLQNEVQVKLEALGGEPLVVQTSFMEEPWKSSRSVSRRRPPLNSSAR